MRRLQQYEIRVCAETAVAHVSKLFVRPLRIPDEHFHAICTRWFACTALEQGGWACGTVADEPSEFKSTAVKNEDKSRRRRYRTDATAGGPRTRSTSMRFSLVFSHPHHYKSVVRTSSMESTELNTRVVRDERDAQPGAATPRNPLVAAGTTKALAQAAAAITLTAVAVNFMVSKYGELAGSEKMEGECA